jgi:hypothetical protein
MDQGAADGSAIQSEEQSEEQLVQSEEQLECSELVLELRAGSLALVLVLTLPAADQNSDASRFPFGRGRIQRASGI